MSIRVQIPYGDTPERMIDYIVRRKFPLERSAREARILGWLSEDSDPEITKAALELRKELEALTLNKVPLTPPHGRSK